MAVKLESIKASHPHRHLRWYGPGRYYNALVTDLGRYTAQRMSTPVAVLCKDFPHRNYCRGRRFEEDYKYK